MNTKEEEKMKRESSENPERLLVTSKEAPAYNREVIFSYYSWAHDNFQICFPLYLYIRGIT